MTAAELAIILSVQDRTAAAFKNVQGGLAGMQRSLRGFADAARTGLGPFLGGAGAAAISGTLLGIGIRFDALRETSEKSFARMVGSAELAKDALDSIDRASLKIPFAATAIREVGRQLVVAGTPLEDIPGFLNDIGDTASALPGNLSENVLSVGHAFAAMRTEGYVGAGALETFTERGIDAFKALGAQTDVQRLVMKRTLDAMPIPAEQMIARLRSGFREMFGGLGQEQSETLTGVIQNLADIINQRLGKALLPIFTRFKDVLVTILDGVDQLVFWFKQLPKPIQDIVKEWGPWLLLILPTVAIIASIVATIATFVGWIGALGGALGVAAGVIAAVLSPELVVLGIAVFTLYEAWRNNWFGIRDTVTTVVGNLRTMFGDFLAWLPKVWSDPLGAMGDVLKYAADGWLAVVGTNTDQVIGTVQRAWDTVRGWFQWLWDTTAPIASGMWSAIAGVFGDSLGTVGGLVSGAWLYVVALFQWLSDTAGGVAQAMWAAVSGLFADPLGTIGAAVAAAWQYVVSLFQRLSDTTSGIVQGLFGWMSSAWDAIASRPLVSVSGVFGDVVGWFTWLVDQAKSIFMALFGWMTTAWDAIASRPLHSVASAFTEVYGWFVWLANQAAAILGPIWGTISGVGSALGGALGGAGRGGGGGTKAYATGGIVTSPTLAMVGEAGPEAIIPLSRMGGGGGQPIQLVNYGVLAGHDVENWLVGMLDQINRRGRS